MKQSKYKYSVYIEWGFALGDDDKFHPYEQCIINKIKSDDQCIQFDGDNYVSHGGSEGMEFTIHNTLEEAILHSHYDIGAIKFTNITPRAVTSVLTKILREGKTIYDKNCDIKVAITPLINLTFEEQEQQQEGDTKDEQ